MKEIVKHDKLSFSINDNILVREVEDEVYVLTSEEDHVLCLNGTGGLVVKMISKFNIVDYNSLVDLILDNFEISESIVRTDLPEFLNNLKLNEVIHFKEL